VWEDCAVANGRVKDEGETAARILDSAEGLVQVRGFNGFSYADVAAELAVTKASLHYHFPGKAELGRALIGRYASRFLAALGEIDSGAGDPPARLRAYAELYAGVLRAQRMCLCGMLAAEYQTLPEPMRDAVLAFFDANETWVAAVLADGREDGTLAFRGEPREAARLIVSALEGAMLVARSYGDVARFETAAERLLAAFATAP
jgi:TetR/AcrR family transcriptional repressor of nem operon